MIFYKKWKKYNEIQLTKNKRGFNLIFLQESTARGKIGLFRHKQRIHLHVHIKVRRNTTIQCCEKPNQLIEKFTKSLNNKSQ